MANERELAERTENALREIADAKDAAALDAVRVRYLGRKDGELTTRMKAVSVLPAAERPAAGAALNEVFRCPGQRPRTDAAGQSWCCIHS